MNFELKKGRVTAGGRVLVEDLSFVAQAGQVICLVGAQGCGKTLLMRSLLGLWPLEEGYVTLDGEPLTPHSAPWLRRLMAYVPQQLPESLTDSLDALRQLAIENRHVVLVDDPFTTSDISAVCTELRRLATQGLAVVVTCSEDIGASEFKYYHF